MCHGTHHDHIDSIGNRTIGRRRHARIDNPLCNVVPFTDVRSRLRTGGRTDGRGRSIRGLSPGRGGDRAAIVNGTADRLKTAWGTTDYTPRPPSSRARGGHAPRHRRLPAVPARPAPAWAGAQARCPPGPWRGEHAVHAAPRGSPIARSDRDRRAPCGRDGARLGVGARTGRAGAERARARTRVRRGWWLSRRAPPGRRRRLKRRRRHPRNSAARARNGSGHRAAAELAMLPTLLGSEGALARRLLVLRAPRGPECAPAATARSTAVSPSPSAPIGRRVRRRRRGPRREAAERDPWPS